MPELCNSLRFKIWKSGDAGDNLALTFQPLTLQSSANNVVDFYAFMGIYESSSLSRSITHITLGFRDKARPTTGKLKSKSHA